MTELPELQPAEHWTRKHNHFIYSSSPAWRYHPFDPKPWAARISEDEYLERVEYLRKNFEGLVIKLGGEPITTRQGFMEWRSHQGADANVGTAIMTRRFKQVDIGQLNEWFAEYRISQALQTS